jgi:hypothetical protein
LGLFANLLAFATTNWGLLVSGGIGVAAGVWRGAFSFASNPQIQTGATVFMWCLWAYIALSVLYRIHAGIKVISVVDYAHSIIIENTQIAFDKNARKDAPALQVGITIRNVANGPISTEIHEFRVVVGGRALPDSPVVPMTIPRMGPKGLMSGAFGKDAVKDKAEGTASLILHYGPPGRAPTRKYVLKMKLMFGVTPTEAMVANQVLSEEDVPL